MRLSVIIPCYNAAACIGAQLEALATQAWPFGDSWEVIIADNGSTDGSRQIIESYRPRFAHFQLVQENRRGPAFARNTAAQLATGEALLFCDADDLAAPGWLAAMATALEQAEFVAGALEHDHLNPAWAVTARGRQQVSGLERLWYVDFRPYAFGANLGIRRELHNQLGGFDSSFDRSAEDIDYCWRAQELGLQLHFVPSAIMHYRLRDTLGGIFRQAQIYGEGQTQLYHKWRNRGMPEVGPAWKVGAKSWLAMTTRFPLMLRGKVDQARSAERLGWQIGLLRGSLRHRSWLLGTPRKSKIENRKSKIEN